MSGFCEKDHKSLLFYALIFIINLQSVFLLDVLKDIISHSQYARTILSVACEYEFWISLCALIGVFMALGRFSGEKRQKDLLILITILNCSALSGIIIATLPCLL